jgi:5-methyltetrahydrofolate--homocysteine methyltransferase
MATPIKQLQEVAQSLEQGKTQRVAALTLELLKARVSPQAILNEGLIAGMTVVGEKMRSGEMYLPEVLQSASAMQASLKILTPHLAREGARPLGRILLGTVTGDMHDIGKNLVGIMLQGAGFEIVDLGLNVPPERFVEGINAHHPAIVGMSAMLTTTMLNMKAIIDTIAAAGLRSTVKIIIGGAPASQRFADEIGADGYARDAILAVGKVKQLLGLMS